PSPKLFTIQLTTESARTWSPALLSKRTNIGHQALNIFGPQRLFIGGHFVLALGNCGGQVSIRLFLHVRAVKVASAHLLAHRRTGAVGAVAGRALALVGALRTLGMRRDRESEEKG